MMNTRKTIALVGRPNVGKSALFNRILQRRVAIVDEAEGVTRDRQYDTFEFQGVSYTLVDTGGIDLHSSANFQQQITRQAQIAIEEADCCVLVVDSQVGLTDLDRDVAKILLSAHKPIVLAVNKVDRHEEPSTIYEFYGLGIKNMVCVSASQGLRIYDLLEAAVAYIHKDLSEEEESLEGKVAIVGRPNVGKSSLLNALIQEDRCIVSNIPGTTRDSIDVVLEVEEKRYRLIDTAGIRRKHKEKDIIDKFAFIRTQEAIERADVCLLMIDAQEGLLHQDKKILNSVEESRKGLVILVNKWDTVSGYRMEHLKKVLEIEAPFLKHIPILFISVKIGRNLDKIFSEVDQVLQDRCQHISTGEFNRFIGLTLQRNPPPMVLGKRLRIYYATQIMRDYPTFILFVNRKEYFTKTYERYLINRIREQYRFYGNPIHIILKPKKNEAVLSQERTPKAESNLVG